MKKTCRLLLIALMASPVSSSFADEPDVDDSSQWEYVGEAGFMDGWVLPMLGIDQTLEENQWKVSLERNVDNENLYRLVDPYHVAGTAVNEVNLSENTGYIEFDVTDPDHVMFNKVEAGFAYDDPSDGERKFKEFYCVNMLRAYTLQYSNYSVQQIIALLGRYMAFTTFKDGVVWLGYNDADGLVYDAHYGTEYKKDCNGFWTYEEPGSPINPPVNMTARILFPSESSDDGQMSGVKGLEEKDSELRFYSLQGVEIAEPERGVFIRKEGTKGARLICR